MHRPCQGNYRIAFSCPVVYPRSRAAILRMTSTNQQPTLLKEYLTQPANEHPATNTSYNSMLLWSNNSLKLLHLPLEIRFRIYDILIQTEHVVNDIIMRTRKLRGGCGVLEPLSFTCHQLRAELIKWKLGRPDNLKTALGRFYPEVTKINFVHPWTQNTFLLKTRMEIKYISDGDYILRAKVRHGVKRREE